ncbi:MAG: hypothetical protein HC913_21855 [Microscillaceae bacterium]|nr:hypothetical protein [Microscillaceae bacterium]
MPLQFPSWQSVFDDFWQWGQPQVLEEIQTALMMEAREQANKAACPGLLGIDSQSVKNQLFTIQEKGGSRIVSLGR